MPKRRFMSRDNLKLIWMQATDDVMKPCFYCNNCEKCNTLYETKNECKAKSLLSFNKEIENWKIMQRERNKHFKTKPRE